MSSAVIRTVPSALRNRSGCGGARSYVATVAQIIRPNVTTATASRIHLRTLLTGSLAIGVDALVVWPMPPPASVLASIISLHRLAGRQCYTAAAESAARVR